MEVKVEEEVEVEADLEVVVPDCPDYLLDPLTVHRPPGQVAELQPDSQTVR